MKLYLAVAVLLLALTSQSEAQVPDALDAAMATDVDTTIGDRLVQWGQDIGRVGTGLAEKAKTTFSEIQDSKFVKDTSNWFADQLNKAKERFA